MLKTYPDTNTLIQLEERKGNVILTRKNFYAIEAEDLLTIREKGNVVEIIIPRDSKIKVLREAEPVEEIVAPVDLPLPKGLSQ